MSERLTPYKWRQCMPQELCGLGDVCNKRCTNCDLLLVIIKLAKIEDREEKNQELVDRSYQRCSWCAYYYQSNPLNNYCYVRLLQNFTPQLVEQECREFISLDDYEE